jgi:hypothetical protein
MCSRPTWNSETNRVAPTEGERSKLAARASEPGDSGVQTAIDADDLTGHLGSIGSAEK